MCCRTRPEAAARELLLAQSSDWPFILRTGSSPINARKRVTDHILRFTSLYGQLKDNAIDEPSLAALEKTDISSPTSTSRYWAAPN